MRYYLDLLEDLAKHYDANAPDRRAKLQHHVMRHWTTEEIIVFRESVIPSLMRNRHDDDEPWIASAFRDLATFCYLHLGAARATGLDLAVATKMTPNALGETIATILKSRDVFQQTADNLKDEIKAMKSAAREGAKSGVENALPKAYARIAAMSDDELRASTKPKTRKPGGGRPQTKDIAARQVKAVLADMKKHTRETFRAHSAHILKTMKDGDYENPYTTAKDLDAAVRRYCKKHDITPSASTNRTGKWRSTK